MKFTANISNTLFSIIYTITKPQLQYYKVAFNLCFNILNILAVFKEKDSIRHNNQTG